MNTLNRVRTPIFLPKKGIFLNFFPKNTLGVYDLWGYFDEFTFKTVKVSKYLGDKKISATSPDILEYLPKYLEKGVMSVKNS